MDSEEELEQFVEQFERNLTGVRNETPRVFPVPYRAGSFFVVEPSSRTMDSEEQMDDLQMCVLCSGRHSIGRCSWFISKTPGQRRAVVADNQLCKICLAPAIENPKHIGCHSKKFCCTCGKRHHTMLHINKSPDIRPIRV